MSTGTTYETRTEGDALHLQLSGSWRLGDAMPPPQDLLGPDAAPIRRLVFDPHRMDRWDTGLLAFLVRLNEACRARDIEVDLHGLPGGARKLFGLASAVPERQGARRSAQPVSLLHQVGRGVLRMKEEAGATLAFVGEVCISLSRMFTGRAQYRRSDLVWVLQECGPRALPIVTLISLLVGLILAFVGAMQLLLFGAQVYVANLVGVGMAVEMGALMTGIIMAGRTGASFAAQLGSMQVNEEVDALRTMGISPFEFLVLPRMLALVLMMPLLCLYADILGMLGGAIVGIGALDIMPTQYFTQTAGAVQLRHVAQGLVKSVVFGVVIAVCGCMYGMRCGRSAQAVGEATTKAVVQCIVWIVVTDALLTIMYNVMGI